METYDGGEDNQDIQNIDLSGNVTGNAQNVYIGSEVHMHVTQIFQHQNLSNASNLQHEAVGTIQIARRAIDNAGQPTQDFINSSSFQKVKQRISDRIVSILHLYGIPGSGKSEIIRKLAKEFTADENGSIAKWHIECSDKSHNIKMQLESLANALGLVPSREGTTAIECMKSCRSKNFVNILIEACIPILVIVEDPQEGDKEFLEDFIKCVDQIDSDRKFHVYLTSQSKSIINCNRIPKYQQVNIEGFTMEEGMQMLGVSEQTADEEKQAVQNIISRLSKSPLGLRVVAATAEKSSMNFQQYDKLLHDGKTFRHLLRRESLEAEKLNQPHLYKAILMLLGPERTDETNIRNWKAISALSLCHHGSIPTVLVARIVQNIRNGEHDLDETNCLNTLETDDFLNTYKDFGLCKVESNGITQTCTFHEAVFVAVRSCQENNRIHEMYPDAVQALASLVHKDLRSSDQVMFMRGIVPHMQALLDKYQTFNKENKLPTDDLLLCFCTGHLYEVIGTVLSNTEESNGEKAFAKKNLQQSIHILSQITSNLGFHLDSADLLTVRQLSEVSDFANKIVDMCISCGNALFQKEGFKLEKYLSTVLQFGEIDFLTNLDPGIMGYIKHALELNLKVPPEKLAEFQQKNNKMFLNKEDLYKTYLVERFVSVFHSISRLILYNHSKISTENRHKSVWFSTLAFQLCENCCQKTGVSFLLGQLTQKSLVDIFLKSLKVDPQKEKTLGDAKSILLANRPTEGQSATNYYEHGLVKQIQGNAYTEMHHNRFIVRINCKFLLIGAYQDLEESTAFCKKLEKLSRENLERWPISLKCLVDCSKFWRLQKQYLKAADAILVALQHQSMEHVSEVTWTYPWACKNYARIVICGKLLEHKDLAVKKCKDALKEEHRISKSLVERIKKCLEEIDKL